MEMKSLPFKRLNIILFLFFCLLSLSIGSYAQLAVGECSFVGSITSNSVPSSYDEYWNQITPENGGKWGSVESTRDVMTWTDLDIAYNYALENGLLFKQHTFVWDQQKPSWIDGIADPEEQKEEVEEWIKAFGDRYPQTDFIDVVNEPLHAAASFKDALGGSGVTGYDWIIWSFEKAREYNPNAKLLLNDYNIVNNTQATNNYLFIINLLKERELIDGIGIQAHFLETTPNGTIKTNLDALAATGLPIYVSEYDVNIANDAEQLAKISEQFPLIYEHEGVAGVTFWGYIEGQIWRENAYLLKSNGTERPSLKWLRTYLAGRCSGETVVSTEDLTEPSERILKKMYPNPIIGNELTLEIQNKVSSVSIADITGKIVYHQYIKHISSSSIRLNLSLDPGVYVITLEGSDQISVNRIVVR